MKRILLGIVALLLVSIAAGAVASPSRAFVCKTQNWDSSSPWYGQCLHWPDTVRSNGTNVSLVGYNGLNSGIWVQAMSTAFNAIKSVPIYNTATTGISSYTTACISGDTGTGAPQYIGDIHFVDVCLNQYTYTCGGSIAPRWNACTNWWVFGQSLDGGQTFHPSNHVANVIVDVMSNPQTYDGQPISWTQQLANEVLCHEAAGHGLGGDHTVDMNQPDPYKDVDPTFSSSCLAAVIYPNWSPPTPSTLGSDVINGLNAQSNHNDSSYDGYGDLATTSNATLKSTKKLHKYSRLRLRLAAQPWLYEEAPLASKPVEVTVAQLRKIHTPPPVGIYYVVRSPGHAFTATFPFSTNG